jgi:hypothetical protein
MLMKTVPCDILIFLLHDDLRRQALQAQNARGHERRVEKYL